MRGTTISVDVTLVTEQCCECGVLFALPQELKEQLLRLTTKGSFYCPNGHGQHYTGESAEAKIKRLERERDAAKQAAEAEAESARYAWRQADMEVFERKRVEREKRKLERRAAAAVCPVKDCKRTIQQMDRHLRTKHPEWVQEHLHVEDE